MYTAKEKNQLNTLYEMVREAFEKGGLMVPRRHFGGSYVGPSAGNGSVSMNNYVGLK